ncbi:hypothetical protein [Microcoleus sp. B4-C2]
MPVPQKMNFIVEQASCLFLKYLSRMVPYLRYNPLIYCFSTGGKV